MNRPHLIAFVDPMCSWCWGFAPVLEAIHTRFGDTLPLRLIMGGLRPGTTTPMRESDKASIREHWQHVHEASGQPFDMAFFDRASFVYDTEPAARAVVVMRRQGEEAGHAALARIQRAFYAENRVVTASEVLAEIAAELGHDANAFRAAFAAPEARQETQTDYMIAQQTGVRGFPTVIAGTGQDNRYAMVTHGYQPASALVPALEGWLASLSAPAAS